MQYPWPASLCTTISRFVTHSTLWRGRYEESVENFSAVSRVMQSVNAASTMLEATHSALSEMCSAFGWDYASFWRVDSAMKALTFVVDSGEVNQEFAAITRTSSFRKGVGLSGRVWAKEDVVFASDIGEVTDCVRAPVARKAGVRSGICIPIFLDGSLFGTMEFFTARTVELSEDRLTVFRTVSRLVSGALTRLNNLGIQLEARRDTEAVADVIRAITSAQDSKQAVLVTLNAVRQSFNWEYGSFWRVDDSRSNLLFEVDSGSVNSEFREVTSKASFRIGVGLAGRAWSDQRLQFTPDIGEVSDCCRAPVAKRAGVRAGVCFPIILGGEVLGTMDFFTVQSITLSNGRSQALQLISELVSQTLGKLIESEENRRRTQELLNVMAVVNKIAGKTNLLAINATIEAAHAGHAGRRFAVVAQEVKKLANETSAYTNEINGLVGNSRP